ncbi:MAG: DUF58 domain-containing protein [Gammaproteobacteria bacterium]|nr:DUF58 domain-containing protein [Gammaproteobacteria bacterium]MCH9716120.1 DUF58 domain-containing protein [Gammaproteobacteria bacterium]MCH9762966.1 DUF58 domain-containing protein [Gammaproteobacteria bacterium]
MNNGTIAHLPELIALQGLVRNKKHGARSKAAQTGHRSTRLRGRGMDFADVRNYQAGDEIRHMEWRSTARTGRPHIKLYQEERERPVVLLVDFNPSMYFGTHDVFKSVLAARLAALLAWIASAEGDRVGGFLFSATQHDECIPKNRQQGVLPLLAKLSHYTSSLQQTQGIAARPLNDVLLRLKRVLKPGSVLILISDFYTLDDTSERLLRRIKKHNDLIAYHVADLLELTAPKLGLYPITDGTKTSFLDLRKQAAATAYGNTLKARQDAIENIFNRLCSPYFSVTTETDWATLAHQSFPRSSHA